MANAFELEALLTGEPVAVPETLKVRYPELEKIAAEARGPSQAKSQPAQGSLFDSTESSQSG